MSDQDRSSEGEVRVFTVEVVIDDTDGPFPTPQQVTAHVRSCLMASYGEYKTADGGWRPFAVMTGQPRTVTSV